MVFGSLVFGKNDTVGFSVIASNTDRLNQMKTVYGSSNLPYLHSLHFYGTSSSSEETQFKNAYNTMKKNGIAGGWIIGEAFYNDSTAASGIQRAITSTGQTVFYLTQWPLARGASCADVSVAPPSGYSNYSSKGF